MLENQGQFYLHITTPLTATLHSGWNCRISTFSYYIRKKHIEN